MTAEFWAIIAAGAMICLSIFSCAAANESRLDSIIELLRQR